MTTTTPISIDEDPPEQGIPRPERAVRLTVLSGDPRIDATTMREPQSDETCMGWRNLAAVCAVGVAAWALVVGAAWFVALHLDLSLPTVVLLDV